MLAEDKSEETHEPANETGNNENNGDEDDRKTLMNELDDYIEELESLFGDLRRTRSEQGQGAVLNGAEKARYEAILCSTQKLLEIINFEIFYSDSKVNRYGYFQEYTKYRDEYKELCCAFSSIKLENSNNGILCESGVNANGTSNVPPGGFLDTIGFNGAGAVLDENNKKSVGYLKQGKRLLEEANQYGQQVLLNLSTQREQLKGAEKKVDAISHALEDSSLILDKMTKWWHKLV
ncbi:hypothetical protein FG386_002294 [Cryptosporidium ryanae]|uniref:uncharacterized protein n=1 Tax=Cryptosporidium ryanae TaxID=515981 RepID=UPI00351A6E88|nr:hypothetical protein FG386_002294 [Cryptosporidium ryanae]